MSRVFQILFAVLYIIAFGVGVYFRDNEEVKHVHTSKDLNYLRQLIKNRYY
jgi:hypothetical protein